MLTNEKYQILKFGLNCGFVTHSNERSVLAYTKDVEEQIETLNICHSELYPNAKMRN